VTEWVTSATSAANLKQLANVQSLILSTAMIVTALESQVLTLRNPTLSQARLHVGNKNRRNDMDVCNLSQEEHDDWIEQVYGKPVCSCGQPISVNGMCDECYSELSAGD
jgi:hypothetical protein